MSEDTSKQFLWSTPSFNTKEEETNHLYNRYIHMMSEDAIPAEPTREQEIAYLDFLQKSFSKDPFLTIHPKLYGASPFRLYWRNYHEMQLEYRKTFAKNFFLSAVLSWPLVIYLANRRRYHKTGVPITYLRINLFTPDYRLPDSYYSETARRKFRYGVLKWATILGFLGAYMTTDSDYMKNDLNMRPDFSQMRILTPMEKLPVKEKKAFEILHGDYFGVNFRENNTSIWQRGLDYFYPWHNYQPIQSQYVPFFDYKKDFATEEFNNHYHFDI